MKKIICLVVVIFFLAGCAEKPLIDDYSEYNNQTAAQIFNSGELDLAKHNYADAVQKFEALDALYPFGKYAEQSLIDSVYAYYVINQDPLALSATDRYLRLYPRGTHVDYVLYMKGLINYKEGLTWLQKMFKQDPAMRDIDSKKEAFAALDQLITLYPRSPYAHSAILMMRSIRNMFARKEVNIAKYYYQRQAYVAAANRASDVLQHFKGSPQAAPALVLMVKSYRALKLYDQANNALKILAASYPHTSELAKLKAT